MNRRTSLLLAALLLALFVVAQPAAPEPDYAATGQAKAAEAWPYTVYLPFVMTCDMDSPIMCYLKGPGW